jgi:hypothetical protein
MQYSASTICVQQLFRNMIYQLSFSIEALTLNMIALSLEQLQYFGTVISACPFSFPQLLITAI